MITIRLFCVTGMLTTLLMNKIKDAARLKQLDIDVKSIPDSQLEKSLVGVDVVLLGPQIEYKYKKIKPICDSLGIPSGVIKMKDYGMMNGQKILDMAINLIENMKQRMEREAVEKEIQAKEEKRLIEEEIQTKEELIKQETQEVNVGAEEEIKEYTIEEIAAVQEIDKNYKEEIEFREWGIDYMNNFDELIKDMKELLSNSEKEVFINTNLNLEAFEEEFNEISQRGVRITVIAAKDYVERDLQIDKLYVYIDEKQKNTGVKLAMVVDNEKAILADQAITKNSERYVITEDPLIVSNIDKNISNFIYILKLRDNLNFKLKDN